MERELEKLRNSVGGARLSHTLFDKSHIVRRRATHFPQMLRIRLSAIAV